MVHEPEDPLDPLEVCTLEPEQLTERLRWIRREILSEAVGRVRLADGVAIEVRDAPGMKARVDHWIELEGACCGGIRFERHASTTPDRVRIEVHGIDPDGSLFESVPELPEAVSTGTPGRFGRVLRAGGLGAVASVFLFCVLPMGLVALLGGTAVAASLSALDDPVWLGAGTLAAGVLIWRWSERRRRLREA